MAIIEVYCFGLLSPRIPFLIFSHMVLKFIILAFTGTFIYRGVTGYIAPSRVRRNPSVKGAKGQGTSFAPLLMANSDGDDAMGKFVPVFFGTWALGYTIISAYDTVGGGLGDMGGYIGAGFAVFLLLALVAAAAYETFRDFE